MDYATSSFLTDPEKASIGDEPSGSGSNASVFPGVEKGTVVKIGSRYTDAWLLWATYCMSLEEPAEYMPKVHGVVVHKDGTFHALCEAYEEVPAGGDPVWCVEYLSECLSEDVSAAERLDRQCLGIIDHFAACVGWDNARERLEEAEYVIDLHTANWMQGGGLFIANDPLHLDEKNAKSHEEAILALIKKRAERDPRIVVR